MMTSTSNSTPPWSLKRLLRQAGIEPLQPLTRDCEIHSLIDDSRQVKPGCCFVAVRGASVDGHQFLESVVRGGATAVVVEGDAAAPCGATVIRVDDTRSALSKLAAAYYGLRGPGCSSPRIVGITGTNGKTTVAWLLRSIFRAAGCPTALFGTVEYDLVGERLASPLTTPGSLELCGHLAAARERGATHAVMEVSSHALEQRRVDGLSFDAAVFTNLSGDHLDYHKTMEEYFAAKRRLFEMIPPQAVAVINADDPRGDELCGIMRARVVRYAVDDRRADWSASIERMDRTGTQLRITWAGECEDLHMSMIGRHNVQNLLAAAATADAIGLAWDAIREGLESCGGAPGRLQRAEPSGWPFSVFVDYAHTDDALRNVLTALRPLTAGRLICVFGCGGDRDRSKRPRMAAVADELADVVFVTSDNPRTEKPESIIDEIVAGFRGDGGGRVEVEVDRRRAIRAAIAEAGDGDTVLIAGKGHENYQIIGRATHPFDDVEEARKWMRDIPRAVEAA